MTRSNSTGQGQHTPGPAAVTEPSKSFVGRVWGSFIGWVASRFILWFI